MEPSNGLERNSFEHFFNTILTTTTLRQVAGTTLTHSESVEQCTITTTCIGDTTDSFYWVTAYSTYHHIYLYRKRCICHNNGCKTGTRNKNFSFPTSGGRFHSVLQERLTHNRHTAREAASSGKVPNFSAVNYVLKGREEFTAGEKLALRRRGPRRVVRPLLDYIFRIEDLRNRTLQEIHRSR